MSPRWVLITGGGTVAGGSSGLFYLESVFLRMLGPNVKVGASWMNVQVLDQPRFLTEMSVNLWREKGRKTLLWFHLSVISAGSWFLLGPSLTCNPWRISNSSHTNHWTGFWIFSFPWVSERRTILVCFWGAAGPVFSDPGQAACPLWAWKGREPEPFPKLSSSQSFHFFSRHCFCVQFRLVDLLFFSR